MYYNESRQAWSNLLLKNELINEFPQLKEKKSAFSYELTFCRTVEELNKTIKRLLKKEGAVPLLLWMYKDG
jgi:hypothetical protein